MKRWLVQDANNRTLAAVADPAAVGVLLPAGGRVIYGRRVVWRDDLAAPFDAAKMLLNALSKANPEKPAVPPRPVTPSETSVAEAIGISRATLWRRRKRAQSLAG